MEIEFFPPMLPSRPCRFCLSLQGGSVFSDFDVDPDGRVFAVRVSFDGYGCCDALAGIGRMSILDSESLLATLPCPLRFGDPRAKPESALRELFADRSDTTSWCADIAATCHGPRRAREAIGSNRDLVRTMYVRCTYDVRTMYG